MEKIVSNKVIVDKFIFLYNFFNINMIKNLLTIIMGHDIILVKLYELKIESSLIKSRWRDKPYEARQPTYFEHGANSYGRHAER